MKLRRMHHIEIEASIPVSMNSCRGVASHCDFVDMTEDEIVDNMYDQGVIGARKITKFVDGARRNTASVTLTFAVAKLSVRQRSVLPQSQCGTWLRMLNNVPRFQRGSQWW